MSFIEWINKTFTHVRDTVGDYGWRTVLHIPIGILMGISPIPSDKFVDLFIYYEKNEDFHTKDQAWKDVSGALIGYGIGRALLYCGIGYLVWLVIQWLLQ